MVKCAECQCTPAECNQVEYPANSTPCPNCKVNSCCCLAIHSIQEYDKWCNESSCSNADLVFSGRNTSNGPKDATSGFTRIKTQRGFGLRQFFLYAKGLYAAALGIEILCISAAEIGENTGLYLFGFNVWGIIIAYAMGYALAGFATFITILGRYDYNQQHEKGAGGQHAMESCCSVLEQNSTLGFVSILKTTFTNFTVGFNCLFRIRNQRGLMTILRSSLFILVTAESVCILTAETVDLIFYQYSLLLSVPLALLAGSFTVVAPAAYRRVKQSAASAKTSKIF